MISPTVLAKRGAYTIDQLPFDRSIDRNRRMRLIGYPREPPPARNEPRQPSTTAHGRHIDAFLTLRILCTKQTFADYWCDPVFQVHSSRTGAGPTEIPWRGVRIPSLTFMRGDEGSPTQVRQEAFGTSSAGRLDATLNRPMRRNHRAPRYNTQPIDVKPNRGC